jgi:queuosine precursor transporter
MAPVVEPDSKPPLRLLPIMTGVFTAVLVLVPSMSSKFISIGDLAIVGSTLIFPITFIFNDILTEVYGFKLSRLVIWTGMVMQIFAALFYWLIEIWPAPDFWDNQEAYSTILGQAPRIVLASLSAYFCGEFANSLVLSRMKYRQKGRPGTSQAGRFVWSTVIGEGLDSFVFMTVAFLGTMPTPDLFKIVGTIWIVKVLYEVLMLPVSMRLANWVKKVERIDVIDDPRLVSYNPFAVGRS